MQHFGKHALTRSSLASVAQQRHCPELESKESQMQEGHFCSTLFDTSCKVKKKCSIKCSNCPNWLKWWWWINNLLWCQYCCWCNTLVSVHWYSSHRQSWCQHGIARHRWCHCRSWGTETSARYCARCCLTKAKQKYVWLSDWILWFDFIHIFTLMETTEFLA